MEPLTVLSLLSAIAQFIDFSTKVLAGSKELYQSATGELSGNVELQTVVCDLRLVGAELELERANETSSRSSSHDLKLQELAASCKTLSDELLAILSDLAVEKGNKKFQSVRQALRSVWKEKQIKEIERQLEAYRGQLTLRMLSSLRNDQSELQRAIKCLIEQHKSLGISGAEKLDSIRQDVSLKLQNVSHKVQDLEISSKNGQNRSLPSSLFTNLYEEYDTVLREQMILQALKFDRMQIRWKNVSLSHRNTFSWIFEEYAPNEEPRHDFVNWLKSRSEIFWISGKAGSGKSTLLKYICNSEKTTEMLKVWAQQQKLVIANFFFWNAGTELEKSQEGLLRALLFEILRHLPHDVRYVMPERWEKSRQTDVSFTYWTRAELLEALDTVTTRELGDTKFCLFIDGLDEYADEHWELINMIKRLSQLQNIKICVSSRPWTSFRQAFGHDAERSLKLHEFTSKDIARYVHDHFQSFTGNSQLTEDLNDELVQKIVDDAEGVFLWVYLAVKYLSHGFLNQDNMSELKRRLEELPKDLEEFYTQMFNSIEPFYRRQTAQILLVCLAADQPPYLVSLSFLDEDAEYAIHSELSPMGTEEVSRKVSQMKARINARCKDLLEVHDHRFRNSRHLSTKTHEVNFLHRTVKDFLLTSIIFKELQCRVDQNFDADIRLCQIYLAQLKRHDEMNAGLEMDGYCTELMGRFIHHASVAEHMRGTAHTDLLVAFDRALIAIDQHTKPIPNVLLGEEYLPLFPYHDVLIYKFAVSCGLQKYIQAELDGKDGCRFGAFEHDLVKFALFNGADVIRHFGKRRFETLGGSRSRLNIIKLLLDSGLNPNEGGPEGSAWICFLRWLRKTQGSSGFYDNNDRYVADLEDKNKAGYVKGTNLSELIAISRLFISRGASFERVESIAKLDEQHIDVEKLLIDAFGKETAMDLIRERPGNSWTSKIGLNALQSFLKPFLGA